MSSVKIRLFGKLSLFKDDHELACVPSAKAKELLCYLLLHRDRPHSREILASTFWGDCTTKQSKKNFRQTLWQLQHLLSDLSRTAGIHALQVDGEYISLDPKCEGWLDVAGFEKAFALVRGLAGEQLNPHQAQILRNAVSLYRGDLLEGWFQEWCIYHRERLQSVYLAMMDKLMCFCECYRDYEGGLGYGERLLAQDRGRERTYLRMMRLHYLAGDRAGAIRRFQRCVAALEEELSVKPSKQMLDLYDQICRDELKNAPSIEVEASEQIRSQRLATPLTYRLSKLRSILLKVHKQVQQDLRDVDEALAVGLGPRRLGGR